MASSRSRPWPISTIRMYVRPHRQHAGADTDRLVFRSPASGEDLIAAFANFPDGFGQPWQVITLTPIDDFVGTLKATNRLIMVVIMILTMIELFFIYFASSRLSRPVENVSRAIAGDRKPAIRRAGVAAIQYSGDREARIRGFAASQLAEIVFVVCAAGYRPATHQVGHSADAGRRAAIPHRVLFRPGEFFHPLRNPRPGRSAGADIDLSRAGFRRDRGRRRNRRQVHRRRRHGVLECPGSAPRPCSARLCRRVAGGTTHGAGER